MAQTELPKGTHNMFPNGDESQDLKTDHPLISKHCNPVQVLVAKAPNATFFKP